MAREVERVRWNHTGSLVCTILNLLAKSPVKLEDVHPMKAYE